MKHLFGICVVIMLFYLFCGDRITQNRRDSLKDAGNITIGEVVGFTYEKSPVIENLLYRYKVNNKVYRRGDRSWNMDNPAKVKSKDIKEGDRYIVLYDKENPKKSIIRVDYEILDDKSYDRYVKEIMAAREARTGKSEK